MYFFICFPFEKHLKLRHGVRIVDGIHVCNGNLIVGIKLHSEDEDFASHSHSTTSRDLNLKLQGKEGNFQLAARIKIPKRGI